MHDFLLAKEIVDEVLRLASEKKLKDIKSVDVEVGRVNLAHDGFSEHAEDVSLENLQFGLESIAKNTLLEKTQFNIRKTAGDNWKITALNAD